MKWPKLPSWIPWQSPFKGPADGPLMKRSIPKIAPGWHELGMEFTCAEGEYSRDPAVTAAIKKFMPDMIPLWVRWAFWKPDSGDSTVTVFGRHAIGRYDPALSARSDRSFYEQIRTGYYHKGPVPNIIEKILCGELDPEAPDLPGKFIPWDWALVKELKDQVDYTAKLSIQDLKEHFIWGPKRRQEEARLKAEMEYEYIMRDIGSFVDRCMATRSEVEMKEFFHLGGKWQKKSRPTYFT